jgi:hypothetical protein
LLQLPDDFLAGRHDFDTYIRCLAVRAEFGPVDPEAEIKRVQALILAFYSRPYYARARARGGSDENPAPVGRSAAAAKSC